MRRRVFLLAALSALALAAETVSPAAVPMRFTGAQEVWWAGRHYWDRRREVKLKEIAKVKSGSASPNRNKVAEITWDQVKTIAEDKLKDLNCFTIESAMKQIAGTARSMGITVKGDFPA